MSENAWVQIAVATISLLGVFVSAYFAYKASKYAKPVGNGFAEKVLTNLQELTKDMGDLKGQIGYVRGRIDALPPATTERASWAESRRSY